MPKIAAISAALTALCAGTVLAGAPASAASPAELSEGRRSSVYVQGDSLTVGAGPIIKQRLRGDVRNVSVDAEVGRFTATGMRRLAQSGSAKRAKVWVVALGTNDAPDPRSIRRHVVRSLQLAGPQRQVIWLTVQRPGPYGRVNEMLRQLDRQADRLTVVDWARHVHDHPGLLAGDGVHATATGYRVRGEMISNEALRLARTP